MSPASQVADASSSVLTVAKLGAAERPRSASSGHRAGRIRVSADPALAPEWVRERPQRARRGVRPASRPDHAGRGGHLPGLGRGRLDVSVARPSRARVRRDRGPRGPRPARGRVRCRRRLLSGRAGSGDRLAPRRVGRRLRGRVARDPVRGDRIVSPPRDRPYGLRSGRDRPLPPRVLRQREGDQGEARGRRRAAAARRLARGDRPLLRGAGSGVPDGLVERRN